MIIRKPYAFLIKNFKKIHVFLLLLSLFVAYKLLNVSSFVSEFMNLGTYDFYNDPITNYISFFLMLSVLLLVVGSLALIFLLRYKKKPWKVYLVPFFEYLALFFVLGMIKSFFNKYSYDVETTDLRLSRDLLFMFIMAQLPAIGIYGMRVFGLDIQKFNFNSDQEFLELSEKDREEIEISLSLDKDTFKRGYKRLFRNVKYVYLEHKKICISVIILLVSVFGYNLYKMFFVTNKSYTEGEIYNANGYSITINKSYFTNKDNVGNVISNKSNFLVLDLTLKNNAGYEKFEQMVKYQHGNIDDIPVSKNTMEIVSKESGYVKSIDALKIGELARKLGAGRKTKDDVIDPGVGFVLHRKVSDKVEKGESLATIYYNEKLIPEADVLDCFEFSNMEVSKPTLIYEIIK